MSRTQLLLPIGTQLRHGKSDNRTYIQIHDVRMEQLATQLATELATKIDDTQLATKILEANPLLILFILETFECLRLHTLHAKPRENEFESLSGKCLSEDIRQLILCPLKIQLNHSIFYLFSNEMMSDVDVFRPEVLDIVAAEGYGTLVVTIQRDAIVCKAIIR
ncbi:hypothetical protein Tco_0477665 [Tanacetum coccineum]